MNRTLSLIAALYSLAIPAAMAADPELVLVASSRSPVARLPVIEARKLFLGIPVKAQGQALKAVRNATDSQATEIFMQKVMFMSADDYERQIKNRLSRIGGSRPPVYDGPDELLAALQRDPLAVTYMPRTQASLGSGLKIVGEP